MKIKKSQLKALNESLKRWIRLTEADTYLKPTKQKSFSQKAVVRTNRGNTGLISYNTPIMWVDEKGTFHRVWDSWSKTTGKHIDAFATLFNNSGMNKKEWDKLEVEEAPKWLRGED